MSPVIDSPDFATPSTPGQALLWSGAIPLAGVSIDTSLWASVIVVLKASGPGSAYAALYQFSTADAVTVDQGLLSANVNGATSPSWWLPVTAVNLILTEQITATQQAAVYGSNIVAPGKRMLSDYLPARGFTAVIPNGTAAGTFTRLAGSPVDGSALFADLSGYNGDCDFIARVFTTGGSAQWDFLPEILNYDGSIGRYVYASLTAAQTVAFVKAHPRAYVRWNARNTTVLTAQAQVELDVIPKSLA